MDLKPHLTNAQENYIQIGLFVLMFFPSIFKVQSFKSYVKNILRDKKKNVLGCFAGYGRDYCFSKYILECLASSCYNQFYSCSESGKGSGALHNRHQQQQLTQTGHLTLTQKKWLTLALRAQQRQVNRTLMQELFPLRSFI